MEDVKDIIKSILADKQLCSAYQQYWYGNYAPSIKENEAWQNGASMGYVYALKELLYKLEGKDFNAEKDAELQANKFCKGE